MFINAVAQFLHQQRHVEACYTYIYQQQMVPYQPTYAQFRQMELDRLSRAMLGQDIPGLNSTIIRNSRQLLIRFETVFNIFNTL